MATIGKTMWKPLELHLTIRIINQKQSYIPRGISKINVPIKI